MLRRLGGVGLTCTEFVASEGLIRDIPRMLEMAALDEDEHPAAIQIYGRRPASMAEAARRAVALGADVVDINMGCPSRKVCAHSGGAALLREPDLVRQIVAAVRAAIRVPLTVKMRAGFKRGELVAPQIADICEGEGADALTVHWRTREEAFKGAMDPAPIAAVRRAVSIPVIGNGDVNDIPSARRMLDETGCHGLMVGRGAVRNPWLPSQLACWLRGETPAEPGAEARRQLLMEYVQLIVEQSATERRALGRIKKFCGYYTRGLPHGAPLRQAIFHSQTLVRCRREIDAYFRRLVRYEGGDEGAFAAGAGEENGDEG